ncbi:MAG: hypothetical protein ABSC23_00895 [Bryobacteraceae bacterium]|jgi:hypothetical protein
MFKRLKLAGGSALAFSVLVTLAGLYVQPEAAGAAPLQREVFLHITTRMEPAVATKVTLGNATVQAGRFVKSARETSDPITPFWADDDWVQDLTVYFLNRTNNTIVYAYILFSFSQTTDGQIRYAFPLTLGVVPPSVSFGLDGKPYHQPPGAQRMFWGPHQTMAIHLGDYIDRIRHSVGPSAPPLATLTTLFVDLEPGLFFGDGLQWNGGYRVFDPQTSTWRRMDRDYFPGNINRDWPGAPGWADQQ